MLHVHGFVHPHSDFELKLFVLGILRYRQLFPLGGLKVDGRNGIKRSHPEKELIKPFQE